MILVSFERVYPLLYQRCIFFLFLVCIINVLFGGTKRVKTTNLTSLYVEKVLITIYIMWEISLDSQTHKE
jgi:hypothetical protein